jgi:periplasmic protein CpxP/Spy
VIGLARLTAIVVALVGSATVASAQATESGTGAQNPARPLREAQQQPGRGTPTERQALQRQVRQAFARVVRRQLNLDAGKMQQLQRVDQKYEQQRRQVLKSEREARLNLKTAMQDSTGHPDQDKIAQYMDQLVHGQRQRADLLEGEQKELAGFLSPLQRAQYFALKERVARKLMELQTDSAAGRGRQRRTPPPAP